ncbi:trypsin-like peptidase domain-containing protein [Streptomyces sp. LMG1-1-1.1]|uniref:trypsin-like peptidase domain-containing protein n=1 Tax=Streptomyces sp. LMG1-1-1.1 TaxID=3135245 RepID=UPI003467B60E
MEGWRGLLRASTVALDLPRADAGGTGFLIAPGVVVTCAHVVDGAYEVRGRTGEGTEFALTVSDEDRYRAANGLDIAFLRFEAELCSAPFVLPSPGTDFGDRMWAYGHPKGDYRAGQWAALEYQGDSRLTFDGSMPMPRAFGTPVGEGFSGSPVVNERTGAVCGMLARSNLAGSAHMVPVAEILARCPVPEPPTPWLHRLTDDQLRAGGFRYPGTALRDYLEAAREAADEHPYAALLADVGHIPLSTVYVRQEASGAADTSTTRQPGRKEPTAATSVLDNHRHVLFTGGAGSGKSSVLRRLTFTAASAWLDDPVHAPPYLPVRVTAEQLLGLPFGEALSAAVARDLPGLRRSLPPNYFEAAPMPDVDWLVCVDGLDEVLDPEDRGRVIQLIQRWAREPCLRFVVASRSLVMAEMNRLDGLRRYALLPFNETSMRAVAEAWFTVLKAPGPARRAGELVVGLRQGRLGEAARNPLYLTMICVVAATSDLPRNPADLYRQFLHILRNKGAQRLRRGDPRIDGVTPEFLEAVHEVLGHVAEMRQGGDSRPLVDQAWEGLAATFPAMDASRDLIFRTLTFTGLVTQRGGELAFPHHTIQEYLAAGAIADRRNPKDPEALEVVREAIASERPNVVLFLAARWHEKGMSLDGFVRTVVEAGGWRDLLLCATILSDGLVIDEGLTARFTRAVIKLDGRSVAVGDLKVDSVLDRLYAILGPRELTSIVRDPEVPHGPRLSALKYCVRRGEGAAELTAAFARDSDLPASARIAAARMLVDVGERQSACRELTRIARDPDQLPQARFDAADSLYRVDREAGTELLAEFLGSIDAVEHNIELDLVLLNSRWDPSARTALAEAIATNQALAHSSADKCRYLTSSLLHAERPELLDSFYQDPAVPVHIRYMAGLAMTRGSDGELEAIWQTLWSEILCSPEASESAVDAAVAGCRDRALVEGAARNRRLALRTRIAAVGNLLQLGDHAAAADCARNLLEESDWHDSASLHLAAVFRELGESDRAKQLLLEVLGDPRQAATERVTCVASLRDLGEAPRVRDVLSQLSKDGDIGAAERLSAVDALNEAESTGSVRRLIDTAADAALPGDVRLDAAVRLLNSGHRSTAAELLRRTSLDPFSGTARRISALTTLAEVDIHAASESLHRLMDEPGLTATHLWEVLDLADALIPDAILRERLDILFGDTAMPPDQYLHIESAHLRHRAAKVPRIRRTLDRIANDSAAEPRIRARAVVRSFGLIRYTRWKELMRSLAPEPLNRLSLHTTADGFGSSGIGAETWEYLSLGRDSDTVGSPLGALAGVDPQAAVETWLELLSMRHPDALRELGPLSHVMCGSRFRARADDLLLAWVKDPEAPLADRVAASKLSVATCLRRWHHLAAADATPAQVRTAICHHLPGSGAYNRIPLLRTLVAIPTIDVRTRASAAALLGTDLGEEGRRILHDISSPHTTDPEAHLAAAAAWEELDIGHEAVAAYDRVLTDQQAAPAHHATAAGQLIKWPALRSRAKKTLTTLLNSPHSPVTTRITAAEHLLTAHEPAEAHLGLLRLARTPAPTPAEHHHITALLPPDLTP